MANSTEGQLWIRTARRGDELRSLQDWLSREDELRGRVRSVHGCLEPGQMGGVLDALVVAAGSGGMGAVLAGALSSWITHRRSDIKVTITSEDGRKVELDGHRVDPQIVLEEVRKLLDSPEPPR